MPVPPPDWVSLDAKETGGLDLLGLRAPVQQIGNHLLNGLTSVTPKLRYLPLLTWIAWKYAQARLPDSAPEFRRFAAAQESAVVMANLVHDGAHGRTTLRLIGSDEARKRLRSNNKSLALEPLVKNIGFNIYAAASVQLNLTFQKANSGLRGVSAEGGLRLAEAFDRVIGPTRYAARLNAGTLIACRAPTWRSLGRGFPSMISPPGRKDSSSTPSCPRRRSMTPNGGGSPPSPSCFG